MRYLSQEIRPLLEQRELLGLVLVDREGMVLDAEGDLYPAELLAALFSPLHKLLEDIRERMNIQGMEEISVRTVGPRLRVILQDFTVNDSSYLLIALFPITTFYRQVTTDIVRIVKDCVRRLAPTTKEERAPGPKETGPKGG